MGSGAAWRGRIPDPAGWDRLEGLGKACQSQSPDGIFLSSVETGEGKGQSVAGGTGGRQGVLLTRLSASGFGATNHPAGFCSFGSSFPGPGQPQGTELGWTNTCVPGIAFPTTSFQGEAEKSDFLPSFSVGQLPSFPGAASLRLHRLSPASGPKARPTSSLPHPGAWAGWGFFTFPGGRTFPTAQSR